MNSITRKWVSPAILWVAGLCLLAQSLSGGAPAESPQPPQPRSRSEIEAVLARVPKTAAESSFRSLTILLLDDAQDHGEEAHDYPLWQERWARLLGGSAAWGKGPVTLYGEMNSEPDAAPGAPGVKVLTAHAWPSQEQFNAADVIVASCYLQWDPQRLEQLRQYLARGKGLVIIHAATWTKPKPSAEVGAVLGVGGFQYTRDGIARLQMDKPDHPICLGLPRQIEFNDETYWPPTPEPAVPGYTVLASSVEKVKPGANETQSQVMFWTCQPEGGRVFGCVPGHFTWTFDDPYFRILLLRGIAWAGGSSPYRFDSLVLRGARITNRRQP